MGVGHVHRLHRRTKRCKPRGAKGVHQLTPHTLKNLLEVYTYIFILWVGNYWEGVYLVYVVYVYISIDIKKLNPLAALGLQQNTQLTQIFA